WSCHAPDLFDGFQAQHQSGEGEPGDQIALVHRPVDQRAEDARIQDASGREPARRRTPQAVERLPQRVAADRMVGQGNGVGHAGASCRIEDPEVWMRGGARGSSRPAARLTLAFRGSMTGPRFGGRMSTNPAPLAEGFDPADLDAWRARAARTA